MEIIWTILVAIGIFILIVLGLSFLIIVYAAVELMKANRNDDPTWRR